MSRYETLGRSYSKTRKPDPRITETIVDLLGLPSGSAIADIGAGTGNYSSELCNLGFKVTAIEPSSVMRSQADPQSEICWIDSFAESIPLGDSAVRGALIILAYHHFTDPKSAILEAKRITGNGPVVIFTMSPDRLSDFWLCDYFPYLLEEATSVFPAIQKLASDISLWTNQDIDIVSFPLPSDLTDRLQPLAGLNQKSI